MSVSAENPAAVLREEVKRLRTDLDAARRMVRGIEVNAPTGNAGRRIKEAADAASRRLASASGRMDQIVRLSQECRGLS